MNKRNFLLMATLMLSSVVYAQRVTYSYDAAGNRIARTLSTESLQAQRNMAMGGLSSSLGQKVIISPNPTEGLLYVRILSLSENDLCQMSLTNLSGQTVAEREVHAAQTEINLSSYPSGCYLLSVVINGEGITYKIIKK